MKNVGKLLILLVIVVGILPLPTPAVDTVDPTLTPSPDGSPSQLECQPCHSYTYTRQNGTIAVRYNCISFQPGIQGWGLFNCTVRFDKSGCEGQPCCHGSASFCDQVPV